MSRIAILSVFERKPRFICHFAQKCLYLHPNTAQGPKYCIMLLKFTVDNFRSFGKQQTLDLTASNGIKDNLGKGTSPLGIGAGTGRVVNALALYGANSSGKSNLLTAIHTMRFMVLDSVRLNEGDSLDYTPFLLTTRAPRPTHFQAIYFEPQTRGIYTYGFEYNEDSIVKEWLSAKWPGRSEKNLFSREGRDVVIDERTYPEGIKAKELSLNNNRLFLSLAGQAGGVISNGVINWFREKLRIISGIEGSYAYSTRKRVFNNPEVKENVQAFLCKMDLGFNTIEAHKVDFETLGYPPGMPKELIAQLKRDPLIQVSSIHKVYGESGEVASTQAFDMDAQESAGTNKIFSLSAPLLDALNDGMTLLVDELDSQMHPLISWRLVEMFNSTEENPHSSQLVFTTHDTNLLSSKLFRRDQIWFTEKDAVENTTLYSMMDAPEFKEKGVAPRNDTNYQKNYIQGKYGAIPFLTCDGLGK